MDDLNALLNELKSVSSESDEGVLTVEEARKAAGAISEKFKAIQEQYREREGGLDDSEGAFIKTLEVLLEVFELSLYEKEQDITP